MRQGIDDLMLAKSEYEFAVAMLTADRWVITARSPAGTTNVLTGVYYSQAAALSAIQETSARWLKSLGTAKASAPEMEWA